MAYTSKHAANSSNTMGRKVAGVALVGAATVGAGVSAAGTSSASSVWDRVAACESTSNWHINSGNGFYGGLQFTQQTWIGYGGGAYASRADLASPSQQVAVAQRVLASQGPGAWPVCSIRAGLSRSTGGSSSTAATTVSRSSARSAISVRHAAPVRRATPVASGKLAVDGIIGPRTVRKLQAWVGVQQNGSFNVTTKKALQHKVGTYADGIVGVRTVAALQSRIGISHDGSHYLNARTVRALQAYLNNH